MVRRTILIGGACCTGSIRNEVTAKDFKPDSCAEQFKDVDTRNLLTTIKDEGGWQKDQRQRVPHGSLLYIVRFNIR